MITRNKRMLTELQNTLKVIGDSKNVYGPGDRWTVLNGFGSMYIMYYSEWVRVTTTGVKAEKLAELILGKSSPVRLADGYPTWELR